MQIIGLSDSDIARRLSEVEQAFSETMELLGRGFTASITSTKWQWPTGDSPRDIVDKGRLRDSQSLTIENNYAEFVWAVSYAAAVHEGIVFKNGTTLPSRRWTEDAINDFDMQRVFSILFERYSGLRRL